MAFEKPPSLEDFDEILPKATQAVTPQQKRIWGIIAVFGVLVIILAILNLSKSDLTASLRGTGAVRGVALDPQGNPFNGDIFVTGTTLAAKTNSDGSFELHNIPVGKRLIVVADNFSGREYPVTVSAGEITNMGTVQFKVTAEP
jgi:hypothetical protein